MPLKKRDAERMLGLLWDFRSVANEQWNSDNAVFGKAISMLHAYLTDVLPATQRRVKIVLGQETMEVTIAPQLDVQLVEMDCKANRDLGIHLQTLDGLVRAQDNFCPVYICRLDRGSVAEREGVLKRGDIVVEVNKRSLMHASLDRARWLLKSAARTHKVTLAVITGDGRRIHQRWKNTPKPPDRRIVRDQFALPYPMQEKPQVEVHPTTAEVDSKTLKPAWHSGTFTMDRRNSLTPSIGSHNSSHELLVNTVEVAAHISRSSFRYSQRKLKGKGRKPCKITIDKDADELGMKLMGGKGSRFGDVGIFVAEIVPGKAASRNGRLSCGDELLMVNGKSVVGLTRPQVVDILKTASTVQLLVASTRSDDGASEVSSTVSMDSIAESEIYQMLQSRDGMKKSKLPPKLASQAAASSPCLQTRVNTMYTGLVPQSGSSSPSLARLGKRPIQQWGRLSASAVHKHHQPPPQVETSIVLVKSTDGKPFGFSLCGGKGSKRGDVGLYIRSIQNGGLAAEDGRLQVGDEILEVNGRSLSGTSHKKAAGIIKALLGVVNFRVRTGPGYLDIPNKLKRSLSVKGTSILTTIRKARGEELGLVIAGLTDNTDEYGVFIRHILPHSPADRCKMLRRCDQLVALNEHNLLDLSVEEARELLLLQQRLPDVDVTLQVVRPHSVNALEKLMLEIESPEAKHQNSFRMKIEVSESSSVSEEAQTVPRSPLDQDIIDLFAFSDRASQELHAKMSTTSPHQVTTEEEFPSVVSAIQEFDAQHNGAETILKSMTPILTRPSIASGYSRRSLLCESDGSQSSSPLARHGSSKKPNNDMEMKPLESKYKKRDSTLSTSLHQHESGSHPDAPTGYPTSSMGFEMNHQRYEETVFTTTLGTDGNFIPESASLSWTSTSLPKDTHPLPLHSPTLITSTTLNEREVSPEIPQGFHQVCLSVKKHGKRSIGVTLVNSRGPTRGYPLVRRVIPGGIGAKSDLKVGDRLVSAGGQELRDMLTSEILRKLVEAPKEMELVIWREPNYDMDGTSSGHSQSMSYSESITSITTTSEEDATDILAQRAPETNLAPTVSQSSNSESLLPSIPANQPSPCSAQDMKSPQSVIIDSTPTFNTGLDKRTTQPLQPIHPCATYPHPSMKINFFSDSPPDTLSHPAPPPPTPHKSPPLPSHPPPQSTPHESPPLPSYPPPPSTPHKSPPLPSHPPPQSTPYESPPLPSYRPPPSTPHESPPVPSHPPPLIPHDSLLPSHFPPSSILHGSPPLPSHPPPPLTPCESPPLSSHFPPPSSSHMFEKSPSTPPLQATLSPSIVTVSPEIRLMPASPNQPRSHLAESNSKQDKEKDLLSLKTGQEGSWSQSQSESASSNRIKSLGPVPKGERQEDAPFEIEVTKGLFSFGLGIKQDQNTRMIVVKSIAPRSSLAKDGNLRLGDVLVSINDQNLIGLSLSVAENIIKSLPRGVVKVVAMPPPHDITGAATKHHDGGSVTQANSDAGMGSTQNRIDLGIGNLEPMTSSSHENEGKKNEEEGIVKVTLTRLGGAPLGIEVEGGSDTVQKHIYISQLLPKSSAAQCGKLQRGDQLIMVGNECLIGMTSVEAWNILMEAPKTVEIVAARKKGNTDNLQVPSPTKSPMESFPAPASIEMHPPLKHRVPSFSSLHYAGLSTSPSFQGSFQSSSEDIREDLLDSSLTLMMEPTPPPIQSNTETLTIVLKKEEGQRLGFSIKGGSDNIKLPNIHVKTVDTTGVAGEDGRLKRGDKILTVNGNPLDGVTHKAALVLIKNAGNMVTLEVSRRTTHGSFPAPSSRITSKLQSRQGSGESSPVKSSTSPSPVVRRKRPSYATLVGMQSSQGVKMVELHKGPTGLGMHLKGSLNQDPPLTPITIKEVLPGGVAYKSGKISIGDQILEANGVSFEGMTQTQAVHAIKDLPQGIVRLVLLDKRFTAFL